MYLLTQSRRPFLSPPFVVMRKIYQLLLLAEICGGTALSSCNRASYVFQPNTVTYRGDAAEAMKRSRATTAPVVPTVLPRTLASPLPAPAVAVSHPKGLGIVEKLRKPQRKVRALLAQRVATSALSAQVAKRMNPQRNTAKHTQTQSKTKTFLLRIGGVLVAAGLILFVVTVAANPTLDTGVILITIALASFIAGVVLLAVSLFQKS